MGFFIGFLTVVLAIVSFLMVFIVLMQRPKQEGLGAAFGGGVTDQVFGAQTTNVLQRGTVYLAVMFFVITLILAVLVNAKQKGQAKLNEDLKKSEAAAASTDFDLTPSLTSGDTTFDNISLTEGAGTTAPDTSIKLDAPTTDDAAAPSGTPDSTPAITPTDPTAEEGDAADAVKKLLEEVDANPGEAAVDAVDAAVDAVEEATGTPE